MTAGGVSDDAAPGASGQPATGVGAAAGGVDLPVPKASAASAGPDGGVDLPVPKASAASTGFDGGVDLPVPKASAASTGFDGGVDLPVPKAAPGSAGGGVDLPVPKAAPGGPAGEVDLPVPKAGPGGAGGFDLPVPKVGGGSTDLPIPKVGGSGVDLPIPKAGGAAGVDLPVPRMGPGPSGIDVPTPKVEGPGVSELPIPKPDEMGGSMGLPTPQREGMGGVDLPVPSMDNLYSGDASAGLDLDPSTFGDTEDPYAGADHSDSTPGFVPPFQTPQEDLPIPSDEQWGHLPVPSEVGEEAGGDLGFPDGDYGSEGPADAEPYYPEEIPDDDDYDGFIPPDDVPGLDLSLLDDNEAPPSDVPPAPTKEKSKKKKKKKAGGRASGRKALFGSVIALFLVVVGGGIALGFTPYGCFGKDLITEALFPETQDDALASPVVVEAQQKLALDTYRDHRDAIREIEAARREGRTGEGLTAYLVFLYDLHTIRYGESKQYTAAADRLCETDLRLEDAETPATLLASATRMVKGDEYSKARDQVTRLLAASSDNVDGLYLSGELELKSDQPEKAHRAFERLAQAEKRSPRSIFGLARSKIAENADAEAETLLTELLEVQPNHVGGLLAQAKLAVTKNDEIAALALIDRAENEKSDFAAPLDRSRGLVLKGDILLSREKLDDALLAYREASKLNDQSLRALLGMGEIHHQRGNVAEALANFKLAQGIEPSNLTAGLGVSRALISSVGEGNLKTARTNLEETLQEHPQEPRVHFLLGQVMAELNHADRAMASYEKAIALNEQYLEPYLALSNLHLKRERIEDAMKVLAKARQKMPNDPRIATSLGRGYLDRGEYSEAEHQFRQALRISPNHLPALYSLGVTLRRMSRLNDARATFERLSRIDARYPGLVMEQGLVLERTGQPEQALQIYRRELEQNPEDTEMKLRVAAALVLVGNCDEAMVMLRDVIRQRPDSAEALFFQGRCLLSRRQIAEAERALTRAVDIEGENGNYRAFLGWACLETGNLDRAAAELQRAVELDPTNPVAVWQRGVLLLRSASPQAAVRDLERALELNPEMREVYHYLALAYDQMRRPADAIRYFEMAIAHDADDFESHFTLAQIITDQRGPRSGLVLHERAVQVGRRIEPTPRHYYDALFSYGATLHQVGRSEDALIILREYLQEAPTTSVDREEAIELVRLMSRGGEQAAYEN